MFGESRLVSVLLLCDKERIQLLKNECVAATEVRDPNDLIGVSRTLLLSKDGREKVLTFSSVQRSQIPLLMAFPASSKSEIIMF